MYCMLNVSIDITQNNIPLGFSFPVLEYNSDQNISHLNCYLALIGPHNDWNIGAVLL